MNTDRKKLAGAGDRPGARPASVVVVLPDHFVRVIVPVAEFDPSTAALFKTAAEQPATVLVGSA